MKWISPSHANHNTLFLPALLTEPVITEDMLEISHSSISTAVSDDFLNVWTHGPRDDSATALASCLDALIPGFCDLIKKGRAKGTDIIPKSSAWDLVTEVDMGIETLFRLWINRFYPTHKIVGEEGFKDAFTHTDTVWFIDPIDGTTNYTQQSSDVAVHFACLKEGRPFVSLVALPFLNEVYIGHCEQEGLYRGTAVAPSLSDDTPLIFGTEFMETSDKEKYMFDVLSLELDATQVRYRSIGINLLKLLSGESHCFYKPSAKTWDVYAPLCILYFCLRDRFDFFVSYKNEDNVSTLGSPFEFTPSFINKMNRDIKNQNRAGLIIVTPKSRPNLHKIIREKFI